MLKDSIEGSLSDWAQAGKGPHLVIFHLSFAVVWTWFALQSSMCWKLGPNVLILRGSGSLRDGASGKMIRSRGHHPQSEVSACLLTVVCLM